MKAVTTREVSESTKKGGWVANERHGKKSISSRSSSNISGAGAAARRKTSAGGLRFAPFDAGTRYDGGFVFEAGFVVFEGGLVALEAGLVALDAGFLTGEGIGYQSRLETEIN